MDAQGKADWSRLSLGVVYFSETTSVDCVQRELEETWRRTKRRLSETHWDGWEDLQDNVRRSNAVKFSSMAAPPATTSKAAAGAVGAAGKAPAVATAAAPPGKQPTPLQPKPGVPAVPVRPSPAAAASVASKWASKAPSVTAEAAPTKMAASAALPTVVSPSSTSSGGDDDGWNDVSTVKKTAARPATKAVKTTLGPCTFGLRCRSGPTCTNGPHPDDVERVFACFRSRDERLQYKFRPCTRKEAHSAAGCFFYHERDPQETTKKFCTNCLKEGHLDFDCRVTKKK